MPHSTHAAEHQCDPRPERVRLVEHPQRRVGREPDEQRVGDGADAGLLRSGIHSSRTTKLISTTAWPSVIGRCWIRPEWSTSHGARPTLPRTISARLTPYSTRPTTSCGSRRPSRPRAAGRRAQLGEASRAGGRRAEGHGRHAMPADPAPVAWYEIATCDLLACMCAVHFCHPGRALVGDFHRSPAYVGLADAVRELIGDGRIGYGTRLPSERDLTAALGVSRTTVTRAYAVLRDTGYAEARHGSGTFTRLPGGPIRALDRALWPTNVSAGVIDLVCAAASAPPGIAAAYAEAAAALPAHLGGHGYYPAGLPDLQARDRRVVRRPRPADLARPDHRHRRRARRERHRRQGPGRPARPGADGVADLSQRCPGAARGRRPARHHAARPRRLGPRRDRRRPRQALARGSCT